MKTAITAGAAAARIPEGAALLVGGFMGVGTPHRLIEALLALGTGGLTIVNNDTATPETGVGRLVASGQVTRVITSHIGLNPITQKKMIAGEIEVELVPQGTLVERIRAGGAGLGGVLTPTGVGTRAAEGKPTIELRGRTYLIEEPITGDFALLAATKADYVGNLEYTMTAHNFNPVMALAATTVIAEPDHIVPVGVIPPDAVKTPGVLVDHLIERKH